MYQKIFRNGPNGVIIFILNVNSFLSHSSNLILVISNKYLLQYFVFSKLLSTSSWICNLAITAVLHDNSFLSFQYQRIRQQIPPDLAFSFFFHLSQHSFNQYYCYTTICKIILPACVKASLAETEVSCHKIMKKVLKNMHFLQLNIFSCLLFA